jgi:hypothetical protein
VTPTRPHAKQNQRFVVVLKITDAQPQFARVALIDYLPAGFEIDNPRLVSSGDTGTLDWIENAGTPVHTEFRDDRFTAAFDRTNSDPAVFTVAYVVRAVSPETMCCRRPRSRTCTVQTASAAPAPAGRRAGSQMNQRSSSAQLPTPPVGEHDPATPVGGESIL